MRLIRGKCELAEALASAHNCQSFRAYCEIRDRVCQVLSRTWANPSSPPYLLNASPLFVATLRQHVGRGPRTGFDDVRLDEENLRARLRELQTKDSSDLFCPEPDILGANGVVWGDGLLTCDSLLFYEVLIALDRAGKLPAERSAAMLFAEHTSSWGGFAACIKRLYSNATVLLIGDPMSFVTSYTYLQTAFPGASCLFVDTPDLALTLNDPKSHDFIFIPEDYLGCLPIKGIDLAVSIHTLQNLAASAVDRLVGGLTRLETQALYSWNSDRCRRNTRMTSVRAIIEQYFNLEMYSRHCDKKRIETKAHDKDVEMHLVGCRKPIKSHRVSTESASRVCLAMPLYNETEVLTEALDSLLAQTYSNFELVVLDDSTKEEPGEIVKQYAQNDSRIRYLRNPTRKGMIRNWRACVDAAGSDARYFAWVGDHDLWDPNWLQRLVDVLDSDPRVVLTYPASVRIHGDGTDALRFSQVFDTRGKRTLKRIYSIYRHAAGFGNMVYGLYRLDALHRAGRFRSLLLPDVVLLWELALEGQFRQVHQHLWYRRHLGLTSIQRQRQTLFPDAPWFLYVPWPIWNTLVLLWFMALKPGAGSPRRRLAGMVSACLFFWRFRGQLLDGTPFESVSEFWKKLKKKMVSPQDLILTCLRRLRGHLAS